MDRPSNGHRRHDAGSITVVDLIRRQHGPGRIPSADETDTVRFVGSLLGPTVRKTVERPGSRLARGAKLAGLAFGSIVLCGSVYAASILTQDPAQPIAPAGNGSAVLTGVGALLPDAVAAQLSDGAPSATTTARPTPLTSTITGRPPAGGGTVSGAGGGTGGGEPGAHPRSADPPTPEPEPPAENLVSPADVVRAFYQLVATDPTLATQLLSPSLLDGDRNGFDDEWQGMSGVRIESVRQTSPHGVQAVIRLREPDGTWLRVVESLHVAGGGDPLIDGAELLSAQHG